MNSPWTFTPRASGLATMALILFTAASWAQENSTNLRSEAAAVSELDGQVRELRSIVEAMRAENAQSRAEMKELRQDLQDTRKLLGPLAASANSSRSAPANPPAESSSNGISELSVPVLPPGQLSARVQKLEESQQLLGSKIDEQYQTKVETAAKYRARLSGIVLMNAFRNVGTSDNLDIPNYAQPPAPGATTQASFGATLRQTQVGLEIFGPTIGGAKTSANVQFDFAGGFASTANGVSFGIARMQTASVRLDWKNTSLVAGQDSLFISPLSPTSFASLATPAFAYAGNLWGWTPQIRVEHRFNLADQQTITLQGGILDNLDWEFPSDPYFRSATAGEGSGQPAYAVRTAWSRTVFGHPLSIGVAGYYGRQNWSWERYVDGWSGMTDWQIPILRRLSLSGEFYRGRGAGGLGAAIDRAVVYGANPYSPTAPIRGLNSAGVGASLSSSSRPRSS